LQGRPFVCDGHLRKAGAAIASQSWRDCSIAASKIAVLVKIYGKSLGFRASPYQIIYAAYAASTIHVRNAKSRRRNARAIEDLRICLHALKETQAYSLGVSKLVSIVELLMKRMNVQLQNAAPDLGIIIFTFT